MKHPNLSAKQNSRSTLNRKSSIAKLQIGKFVPQVEKKVSKIITNNSIAKKFNQTTTSILNKFIDKGNQYDFNSRRQSMQSKVSIGSNKCMFEDTTNYSDQIRQLKYKIKQLTQENIELRKNIQNNNIKSRTNSQKYLKTLDIGDILEDSNRVLKHKLSTSRRSSINYEPDKQNKTNSSSYQIQRLYQKAFKQTKMPNIQSLSKAINLYLKQYQDIFIKLNFLVQNIQPQDQQKLSSLKQILSSMKIPIVYYNNPKGIQKINSSKKLLPLRSQSSTRLTKKQPSPLMQIFAPQLLSPQDTLTILQKLLIRIAQSSSMMQSLCQKKTLIKLLKKLRC